MERMIRRRGILAVLLLSGCLPAAGSDRERFLALQDESRERRDAAFEELLRGGEIPAPRLRAAMGLGAGTGFPVVALLYAQGRGDSVPLDLRARHLAAFEWPSDFVSENAVVEPYVRAAVEQDLVRAGRPALRVLAEALREAAGTEAAAMRLVRAMIRIGGRAAADEFAGLMSVERRLDGVRVCDAAAAALLYLGRQDLLLRIASPDERLAAARGWWDLAKDFPEDEWIRDAVEALAARGAPKDPEGVRPVMELLTGQEVDDPKAWGERNRGWRPSPAPLRAEDLLAAFPAGGPRAYDANRRLEEATGVRVFVPRMERVSELCSALRVWEAPPDLELRWRRQLQSRLLRLSIAAIGTPPQASPLRIRWAHEAYFHATEEESGELRIETQTESYALFVQAFDLGTRLVASESHGAGGSWTGTLREVREGRPLLMFSSALKSALVAVVEEAEMRLPPAPPALVQSQWRERLRSWKDSPEALRALGYFQDAADLGLLRERKAGAALLMQGDPAGLEFQPSLEPYEAGMALRKAEDPRVRAYLEAILRSAPRK